jgi:hypothetical protein
MCRTFFARFALTRGRACSFPAGQLYVLALDRVGPYNFWQIVQPSTQIVGGDDDAFADPSGGQLPLLDLLAEPSSADAGELSGFWF